MTVSYQHLVFAIVSTLVLAVPAKAQTYEDAAAAFRSGNRDAAITQLHQLAKSGHARAQYDLGLVYEYGRGVSRDDTKAVKWYRMAAAQHIAFAQYRLAVLHENGWGVVENDTEAVKWYRAAATQGYGLAQHDLAFMYVAGTGVERDYVRAYMWLSIAVAQGNSFMAKHLHHVGKKMTPTEIVRARGLTRKWLNSRN